MKDYYTDNGQLMKNVMNRTYRGYTYSIWATYDSTRYTLHKGKKHHGVVTFRLEIKDDSDSVVETTDSFDLNFNISKNLYTATVKFNRINYNPFKLKYNKINLRDCYDIVLMRFVDYCINKIDEMANDDITQRLDNFTTDGLPNSLNSIK